MHVIVARIHLPRVGVVEAGRFRRLDLAESWSGRGLSATGSLVSLPEDMVRVTREIYSASVSIER